MGGATQSRRGKHTGETSGELWPVFSSHTSVNGDVARLRRRRSRHGTRRRHTSSTPEPREIHSGHARIHGNTRRSASLFFVSESERTCGSAWKNP